jgi:transcriptional regulator with XRE-family HTH domain
MPRHRVDWYGPLLRRIREAAGLSQAQVGKHAGVAGSQINKLETNVNQPTLATALAIADALQLPLSSFISEERNRPTGEVEASGPRGRPRRSAVDAEPAAKPATRKPKRRQS